MEIKPDKYYSLHSIFKMKALPWIKSFVTLKKLVVYDLEKYNGEKFKAVRTGQNQGTRYMIKGENLIELLKQMNEQGFTITKDGPTD